MGHRVSGFSVEGSGIGGVGGATWRLRKDLPRK